MAVKPTESKEAGEEKGYGLLQGCQCLGIRCSLHVQVNVAELSHQKRRNASSSYEVTSMGQAELKSMTLAAPPTFGAGRGWGPGYPNIYGSECGSV